MKIFAFIAFLPFSLSTYAQQLPAISELHWLVGTWAIEKTVGAYEEWITANDTTLTGRSYKVNSRDTLVSETLEIVMKEQAVWYIPTVSNQNQGKPVPFKLITYNPEKLTFENKAHDFPTRIHYFKEGKHTLRVWIEGEVDGQIKKVSFNMKRIH